MSIYIPLKCGCRIELTSTNTGSYAECKCKKSVFVPYDVCFRFNSKLELEGVFKKFCEWFVIGEDDYIHDYENVWEWIDGRSSDGRVGFNISRQHNSSKVRKSNPVIMSLLLHDEQLRPETMGQRIAIGFAAEVTATSPCHRHDATYTPESAVNLSRGSDGIRN